MTAGPHPTPAHPAPNPGDGPGYWDVVERARPESLWRRYSDEINARLVQTWVPVRAQVGRVLKTDLFDEAWTGGFCEALPSGDASLVVGIDASLPIARLSAQNQLRVRPVVADVRALPFRDEAFNLVLSPSTLDHFPKEGGIEEALTEIGRVVAPRGLLLVSLDNPVNPLIALRNRWLGFWRRLRIVPYFVGATLGPAALEHAVSATGFSPVRRGATQHFPRVALVAMEKMGLGRGRLAYTWLTVGRLCEGLARLPTRYLTGQFVATLQEKQEAPIEVDSGPSGGAARAG